MKWRKCLVKCDLTTKIKTNKKSGYHVFFWHKFLILTSLDTETFDENFDLKAKTCYIDSKGFLSTNWPEPSTYTDGIISLPQACFMK